MLKTCKSASLNERSGSEAYSSPNPYSLHECGFGSGFSPKEKTTGGAFHEFDLQRLEMASTEDLSPSNTPVKPQTSQAMSGVEDQELLARLACGETGGLSDVDEQFLSRLQPGRNLRSLAT